MNKFIADSKMFEYDKFFRECSAQNIPFVKARINPSTGNYYVQLDLITCNYLLSDQSEAKIVALFNDEKSFLESHDSPSQGDFVDKELSWFDGILPSRLEFFCDMLYDLARQDGNS